MIGWNDLSGTLPHELSYFKDTLEEIDFGGGTIHGTIPSSWGHLTELKGLALNDNCLSGTIPESFIVTPSPSSEQIRPLRSLERLNVINNPDLSGSLNSFCKTSTESNVYREGIHAIAGDCGVDASGNNAGSGGAGIKCDCCICCNDTDFQCHDPHSGNSWKSYNLDIKSLVDTIKSFEAKRIGASQCRTAENKVWIQQECPCYVKKANGNEINNYDSFIDDTTSSRSFKCTKNCTEEGAKPSFWDYLWL